MYSRGEDRSALLASCYTESLRVADELGAEVVAFPAVSAGIYGWPAAGAARIALAAVRGTDTAVREAQFVLFGRACTRCSRPRWPRWPLTRMCPGAAREDTGEQ